MAKKDEDFKTDGVVKLSFDLNISGLQGLLQSMHDDIAMNTKMLGGLTEDFFQLRKLQDDFRIRLKDILQKADRHRMDLETKVTNLHQKYEALPEAYVGTKEFNNSVGDMHQMLAQTNQRLADVENADGTQVRQFIETHVERLLDSWWEPIRDDTAEEQQRNILESQLLIEANFKEQLEALDRASQLRVQDSMSLTAKNLQDAQLVLDENLNSMRRLQEFDKKELMEIIDTNDTEIKYQLNESNSASTTRFVDAETKSAALYHVLCLDTEEITQIYETRNDEENEYQIPELDRRINIMHNSLPFLELRSKIQSDIRTRIKQMKEEDQDDFSVQVLELQRELKGKASIQKVLEMIHENMDKGLYETVDFLKTKIMVLDSTKVSSDNFCEAMKSKCDLKLLEQKADRSFVNSLFEFLRAKFEQFQEGQSSEVVHLVEATLKGKSTGLDDSQNMKYIKPPDRHELSVMGGSDGGVNMQVRKQASMEEKAKIDSALNPQADYQWASSSGKRLGMPPGRNMRGGAGGNAVPYTYDSQRGIDGRDTTTQGRQARPPVPTQHSHNNNNNNNNNDDIMSWSDGNAQVDDQTILPPLSHPSSPLQPQPPKTRSHEAYLKAVQESSSSFAAAIEEAPIDVYIPEGSRPNLKVKQ